MFGGKGFDEVIGGLGRDILVDLDGGFLTNGQGGNEADTFVGGLNTTIMDFDFSPEEAGYLESITQKMLCLFRLHRGALMQV